MCAEEPRKQSKAERDHEQRRGPGGQEMRCGSLDADQRREFADLSGDGLVATGEEIQENDRDEAIRESVERPSIGVVIPGSSRPASEWFGDRQYDRSDEHGDADRPNTPPRTPRSTRKRRARSGSSARHAVPITMKGSWTIGACSKTISVEVRRHEGVGFAEDDVEHEPEHAQRHRRASREASNSGHLPTTECDHPDQNVSTRPA